MPARSLAEALADSTAAPLLARLARTRQLAARVSGAISALAPDFDAGDPLTCELREGTLLLNARSSAQAAKLRQGVPGLLRLLHQSGTQVTEIRVRVQPACKSYPERLDDAAQESEGSLPSAAPVDAGSTPGLAPPAVAGARALARTLADELPDGELKRAAQRLQASIERTTRGGERSIG